MPYHCHVSLTCKYLYITYMYCFDTGLYFFPAYRTLILCCCFSPFGCLEDKHEIDDDIFFRPFACLRWLLVLEGGIVWRVAPRTSSSCHAEHLFVLFFIFLLVCFRRLSTLLPPLCVIPVLTMGIRVLLLYVSKILHTYFYFFIRAR